MDGEPGPHDDDGPGRDFEGREVGHDRADRDHRRAKRPPRVDDKPREQGRGSEAQGADGAGIGERHGRQRGIAEVPDGELEEHEMQHREAPNNQRRGGQGHVGGPADPE